MTIILNGSEGPQATPFLRSDEFDADDADWYIMQRAIEIGSDPNDALRDVRAALRRRALLLPPTVAQPTESAPARVDEGSSLPWPPGFVGALASFIYQQAPRPVAEVAIVGALGFMAGVAGRAWHISGTGLNLYIVLVGRSSIGKEAMHSGIAKIVHAAGTQCPFAGNFVDPSDFVSGPALLKSCLANPCFVNVAGEIGHKFLAMSVDKDLSMRSLRKELTTLYSKSGPNNPTGGITYSNQENNVASTQGVAFSLIGETTPGTFYESITDTMMRDGFMSRFCVVEYGGDRPAKNASPAPRPPQALVDHIVPLILHAHGAVTSDRFQAVNLSEGALTLLNRFEDECDAAIRAASDDENQRQLWNRAHLKALRVAALLAVGDNHLFPTVTDAQAEWAVALTRHGIAAFARRISRGDVGEASDDAREKKLLSFLRDYIEKSVPPSYKVPPRMLEDGVVPRSYLQMRSASLPAFRNHKLGATKALDETIRSLIASGKMMEIKHDKVVEMYSHHGKSFRVLEL